MRITLYLEETALRQLIGDLLPVTILLDEERGLDGRWIRIDPVQQLDFGIDDGIRLVTSGQLRWIVGFVPVTLTVQRLALMLRPLVVGGGADSRVLFRPLLETADIRNVPDLLDRGIVDLVNRSLEARSHRWAWDVGRMLALRFVVADGLVPLEAAAVGVEAAWLRVSSDAIELTISLTAHISRLAGERAQAI
jgi:hypothetical protein